LRRSDLRGLGNAFHRDNLASILERGILSHNAVRAARITHSSLADAEVNATRANRTVPPSGRPLHSYANLYINPRNICVYKFIRNAGGHENVCVVKVSLDVLDLPGVIVTDRNAASWPTWKAPDEGLAPLDRDDIFAEYWSQQDRSHAQRMCAEVLVPDVVEPRFITKVYVSCDESRDAALPICGSVPVEVQRSLFFLR
jgi:hypothetical protein